LIEVGEYELNRNPDNYFADVEQAAFTPSNLVPGISFSPNTVQLRSWMVICGLRAGCGHRVCWVRLAAHLRTLRLTTRGLARARRTGLRRWASFPMAHCQRAPMASRL
jgi:hypothetical protein